MDKPIEVGAGAGRPTVGKDIGGWLYLVGSGIVVSPLLNFLHARQLWEASRRANWELIWHRGPMTVLSIGLEFGIQAYMLIFSVALAIALGVLSVMVVAAVPGVSSKVVAEALAFPIYVFLLGAIWVPYFVKSKRVKETFVAKAT